MLVILFEALTDITVGLLAQLGLDKYALYVHDYGAPSGGSRAPLASWYSVRHIGWMREHTAGQATLQTIEPATVPTVPLFVEPRAGA
jgi:hypothetical protein